MMQPPPDGGDPAEVDVPAVLLAADGDLVEPLGVGDDLRGVEGLFDLVGEGGGVVRGELARGGPGEVPRGLAQIGVAGDRAGEDRLGDPGDRNPEVECALHGPPPGPLLLGLVQDHVDERLTGGRVGVREHLGGDLDEVRVEPPGVPGPENLRDLGGE